MDVIIVDDEEGMREGMRRVLERQGYTVSTAADGAEAVELLERKAFDLALVDLKMPGIDGIEVIEFINQRYERRTVVVIVSALATVEAAVEVTRHGAFDFLVKPFAPPDLLRVVERAAGQRRLIQEHETYLSELAGERSLSRQLINSLRDGVIVLNINNRPVLMNPRAEYLLGVRFSEELTLAALPLDDAVREVVARTLAARAGPGEYRQMRMERGGAMLQVRVTPYLREEEFAGLIILITDVTEQWQAEQDKNRFVSMVAHELNSPIAAILGYIDVVLSGLFDGDIDRVKSMMTRSKARGEALLSLIQDLQYLNKREAGKIEKTIEVLDVVAVLAEQTEFLKIQAQARSVTLELDAAGAPLCVAADRGDLDRIFMNLISNGIKYNREGGRLSVSALLDGAEIVVRFADTGIGMSREEVSHLFQEFYRVKSASTQGISGTGLGLATVKRVLGEYSGTIAVESEPEVGTTFTVRMAAAGDASTGTLKSD